MKKIIYLADDVEEGYAIKEFLEKRGVKVFPAQTEEEVLVIVGRELTIKLIVIGVRENHTSEFINNPPCNLIFKAPLIIDEDEQRLRTIYKPVSACFHMEEKLWREKLRYLVDNL